jgi:osmoprotectant transport system ATP-binding protein
MNEPMIALQGVCKSFDGGRTRAVNDVSLSVARGGFVALVGGSGSGKTTLLKTINRLIVPDSGSVRVDGEAVDGLEAHALRRRIGYVFQEVGLFPHLSVGENIAITPKLMGMARADRETRAAELLELVSLPRDYAARRPAALSGGQRQRVGVARAPAPPPRKKLMDEPIGAQDPVVRDALGSEYRRLHEQLGLTTLMVTHDMTEAVLLADRIVVMDHGRLIAEGLPSELLADERPEVRGLIETPRRQAERVRERLERARG